MKKLLPIIISFIIGVAAASYIFDKFGIKEAFQTLSNITIPSLLTYIAAVIGIMLVLTWRWHTILKGQQVEIGFLKLFGYRIAGFMASYVTPVPRVGGEGLRVVMLKKDKIPMKHAASSVMIDTILDLTTSAFFFIVGVFFLVSSKELSTTWNYTLVTSALLFFALMMWIYEGIINEKGVLKRVFKRLSHKKFYEKIEEFEFELIKFHKQNKKVFMKTILISLLAWIVMFVEYKSLLLMLGTNANLAQVFMFIIFIGIAYTLPLPLAIGTLEAGQVGAAAITGLSSAIGLAVSLVVRAKDFIWVIIGLIITAYFGAFHIQKKVTS